MHTAFHSPKLGTSFVSSIHREMLPNLTLHSPGSRKTSTLDSLDNAIHFYSSFDTNPLYFLTAQVLAPIPIPIPVSVEPYFYLA